MCDGTRMLQLFFSFFFGWSSFVYIVVHQMRLCKGLSTNKQTCSWTLKSVVWISTIVLYIHKCLWVTKQQLNTKKKKMKNQFLFTIFSTANWLKLTTGWTQKSSEFDLTENWIYAFPFQSSNLLVYVNDSVAQFKQTFCPLINM